MKKIRYLFFTILCSIMPIFKYANTFAANDTAFSLGPTSQRITLLPGESYRSSVKISSPNTAELPTDFIIYVAPYGIVNDKYEPTFDQESTFTQIAKWIVLDVDSGTINPNENREIGFTINVPSDAPAGGQYATIIAQDVTGIKNTDNSALNISSLKAIGSIVVADIAGTTRQIGSISENYIPSFLLSNNLEASSLVQNDGNIHADAEYTLQVWPLIGSEEVCTNEETPDKSIILPETSRRYVQTCKLPPVGIFKARQTVKIFGESSVAETMVIVCPIWLLFLIIFIIVALIIFIVIKVKNRGKASKK